MTLGNHPFIRCATASSHFKIGVAAERAQFEAFYKEKTINLHLHDNVHACPFYFRTRWSGSRL
jgi:hypothetical protein